MIYKACFPLANSFYVGTELFHCKVFQLVRDHSKYFFLVEGTAASQHVLDQ